MNEKNDIVDVDISTLDDIGTTSPIVISKSEEPIKINEEPAQQNTTNEQQNTKKSVDFGPGIEMLMNPKLVDKQNTSINTNQSKDELKTLDELEKELEKSIEQTSSSTTKENENQEQPTKKNVGFLSGLFGSGSSSNSEKDNKSQPTTTEKTWDGYQKINEVPVEPDHTIHISSSEQQSKEELFKEKFKYFKKLEDLKRKGVKLTKQYDMESSLLEMKGEYETIISEKEKSNSVKFQGQLLTTIVNGLEFLNDKVDPFDLKLKGWSESIAENINDYDEIFEQLHEKYKTKYSMAPELKLFFQILSSAVTVHFTNTMFSSLAPNVENVFKQNPDLAREFTRATVDTMKSKSPGFSNFMNDMTSKPPDDVDMSERFGTQFTPSMNEHSDNNDTTPTRRDMKGPSNIDELLSNIKNTQPKPPTPRKKQENTISMEEIRNMNKNVSSRKSRVSNSSRRKRTERNIVSLDM